MCAFDTLTRVVTVPRLPITDRAQLDALADAQISDEERAKLNSLAQWLASERAARQLEEKNRTEQLRRLTGRTPHEL